MSSMFDATTKEGRARIRSDMHERTWPLGGTPFTNGQGLERLLDACKALEKEVAGREARIAALQAQIARLTAPVTDGEAREFGRVWLANMDTSDNCEAAALTAFLERRIK